MDALATSALIIQALVLYPLGVRYMLANDPGLQSQSPDVRSKRMRIGPLAMPLMLAGVAGATGRLREIAFLWVLFFGLGWRMRTNPNEAVGLANGERPRLRTVGFVLVLCAVVVGAIALGSATA